MFCGSPAATRPGDELHERRVVQDQALARVRRAALFVVLARVRRCPPRTRPRCAARFPRPEGASVRTPTTVDHELRECRPASYLHRRARAAPGPPADRLRPRAGGSRRRGAGRGDAACARRRADGGRGPAGRPGGSCGDRGRSRTARPPLRTGLRAPGPGAAVAEVAATASQAGPPSGSRRTFAPFPSTVTVRLAQVDGVDVEAAALAHPQPGAVEQLEDRDVAQRTRDRRIGRVRRGRRAARRPRSSRGIRGRRRAPLGACDRGRDVAAEHAAAAQVAHVRVHRRGLARDRRLARTRASADTRSSAAATRGRAPTRSGQPPRSHHCTNSSTSCVYARRVCSLIAVSATANPSGSCVRVAVGPRGVGLRGHAACCRGTVVRGRCHTPRVWCGSPSRSRSRPPSAVALAGHRATRRFGRARIGAQCRARGRRRPGRDRRGARVAGPARATRSSACPTRPGASRASGCGPRCSRRGSSTR